MNVQKWIMFAKLLMLENTELIRHIRQESKIQRNMVVASEMGLVAVSTFHVWFLKLKTVNSISKIPLMLHSII